MAAPGQPRYAIARHRPAANTGPTPTRAALPRLKVIVRRLPPGIEEDEFYECLGKQWKPAGERVDWASFKSGKISKDPAKPSKPSRVYLRLTNQDYLGTLSDAIRDAQFSDAKASGGDPALLGPPTVEFAPYGRVPNGKVRKDARQGTIDQDPEFIDFLESLTNPTSKPTPTEGGSDTESKKGAAIVTPLIQYLRDKKANKGKEASASVKATKHSRSDSKESKTSQGSDKKASPKNARDASPQLEKRSVSAIKVEKAAREAVKLLNKQAHSASKIGGSSSHPVPSQQSAPSPIPSPTPPVDRKRERGTVNAVARIQRDLGLAGSPGGRRRRDASTVTTSASPAVIPAKQPGVAQLSTTAASSTTSSPSTVPPAPSANGNKPTTTSAGPPTRNNIQPPTGPAASRAPSKPHITNQSRPQQASSSVSPKSAPPVSTSTQAFLKHANPSQGITEPLLEQAFASFGSVQRVEIDKKKGFAYVDFATPEDLQKAIAASPVKVAQGQVVVLERKTGPTLQARNIRGGPPMVASRGGGPLAPRGGRGGPMRGRGGAMRGAVAGVAAKPVTAPVPPAGVSDSSASNPLVAPTAAVPLSESSPAQPSTAAPVVSPEPASVPSPAPS
ncbi:hypothetical protein MMC13_001937 [Lambiella insularis]|nr:hypothetical protein [Lambiella insularis]